MKKQKVWSNIVLVILGLLILAAICALAMSEDLGTRALASICMLVALAFSGLYAFVSFNEPHGNLLKVAMLVFGFANIASNIAYATEENALLYTAYISAIAAAFVCYGAGRLNRLDKNKILFPIIDVIFIAVAVLLLLKVETITFTAVFSVFAMPIAFTTLMLGYFVRFGEHKEAGEAK